MIKRRSRGPSNTPITWVNQTLFPVDLKQEIFRFYHNNIKEKNGFPQNIWTITKEGHPLEAQLENQDQGVYHGYPMPEIDPFRQVVLAKWRNK